MTFCKIYLTISKVCCILSTTGNKHKRRKDAKNMKQHHKVLLGIILSICLVLALLSGVIFKDKENNNTSDQYWKQTITIENGKVSPESSSIDFRVTEDGNYNIAYSWVPEGTNVDDIVNMDRSESTFITVIKITDKDGVTKFSTSAGAVNLNTINYLEAGDYTATYYYFTDRDTFVEYAKKHFCSEDEAYDLADFFDFENYVKDGTTVMNYNLSVTGEGIANSGSPLIMIGAFIAIFVITIILVIVGKKAKTDSLPEFDERQEIIRGKGFKYGFFTILISLALALLLDSANMLPMMHSSLLYTLSIFAGLFVFAEYCAWNEAYFALNQNSNYIVIYTSLIGVFNLIIFVMNVIRGNLFADGKLTVSFLNLICALLFLSLFVTCAIKKSINAKEESED